MSFSQKPGTHSWTQSEEQELLSLHDDGLGIEDIAVATGIPMGAVRARLRELLIKRRLAQGLPLKRYQSGADRVPLERLAERETRKAAAELRDLTATFFGDPAPGFSALDKRRQSP